MATIDVYDITTKKVGEIELNDSVFRGEAREYLIHEAVKIQLANRRAGTVAVKNRSAVSGGGKKPYKQKGTGQARQGCIRAPHYPGGGVAFGPQPKEYSLKMNKKARKAAISSALSVLFAEGKMKVLNAIELEKISTKKFVEILNAFGLNKTLVVTDGQNTNLELSARNAKDVKVLKPEAINVYDLVKFNNVIFTEAAVRKVEGALVP
ncbi:MAG: 50S ribosomal protein L4 [Geobacter sp.]|nr:50S ribosomal protein L4 [Geobacter sp.]